MKINVISVSVEDADIKRGKMNSNVSCPVARAIRRSIHRKTSVRVMYDRVWIGGCRSPWLLPKKVTRFISNFDRWNRLPSKPFTFRLEANEVWWRVIVLSLISATMGCSNAPSPAGNIVAYRINKTGTLNGADEDSKVIHWATDTPGIWHDLTCPSPCRKWHEVNQNGQRTFMEVRP